MSIRRFFTKQLVVRKLKATTGYKKTYRATATVEGHVQKADNEQVQMIGGIYGQTYIGWLPLDLGFTPEPDDRITDHQGRIFMVKTVEKWDFGINQHYEMWMELYNVQDQ
jgi:hypothetical protein